MAINSCPCGRMSAFEDCCGAIHAGGRPAITAEDLMRSRYSAFAVGEADYLRRSWDPDQVPGTIRLRDEQWIGLEIHGTTGGGAFDTVGTVHFTATYTNGEETGRQSENSAFRKLNGAWVYVGPA